MQFRLIGHGKVFRVVRQFTMLGYVRCVYGISLDGRWQTTARIVDVDIVADTELAQAA